MNQFLAGRRRWSRQTVSRWPVLVALWLLATAVGLTVAATTAIGPTLVSLTDTHGVHLGDVVAFALCYSAAMWVTLRSNTPGGKD